jgi:cell cycle arrest protein BUB2
MANPPPRAPFPSTLHATPNANSRNQAPLRKLRSVQNLSSTPTGSSDPAAVLAQTRQRLRNVSSFVREKPPQDGQVPPLPAGPFVPYRTSQAPKPVRAVTAQNAPVHPVSQHQSQHNTQHGGQGTLGIQKARNRANSDAALGNVSQTGPMIKKQIAAKRIISGIPAQKKVTLESLLREGPPGGDISEGLHEIRFQVLMDGVKSDHDGMSNLRIYVWLILLSAPPIPTDSYLALVHRGASPAYAKIRNDTFRTLATDPLFRRRVSEASLIRLLNAVAWTLQDAREAHEETTAVTITSSSPFPNDLRAASLVSQANTQHMNSRRSMSEGSDSGGSISGIYVQGMNVLAAPFLYAARSEAEAYVAFHRFITTECPGYIQGAMEGVHRGLKLVDAILALVDPKLSSFLVSKGMKAELYAFPSVLTLCACTPPLPEVLHLWDFLFAYGPHLNILCIVAQLVDMRAEILSSPRLVPETH